VEIDEVLASDADMPQDDFPADPAEGTVVPQCPNGLIERERAHKILTYDRGYIDPRLGEGRGSEDGETD
jgi:hypothetical protein